jgi:hypothetical protein
VLHAASQDGRPSSSSLTGSNLVTLDVGGQRYVTSWSTLLAVPDTYFSLLASAPDKAAGCHKLPNGDVFIDRCGRLFNYVLDYLRSVHHNESTVSLPNDARWVRRGGGTGQVG